MNSYVKLLEKLNNGEIEKCKKMLLENIREESAKKTGAKKPYTIINSMFKKDKNDDRMSFKAFLNSDDRFYFSDGHRFFSASENFGFTEVEKENGFDFTKLFKNIDFPGALNIDYEKVKESVSINKSYKYDLKPFIIYDPENDIYCGFNPNFLKDLIDYTGSTTFKYQPNKSWNGNCLTSPIFAFDENNNCLGCVLPVNINNIDPENIKNSDYIVYCENIA